jgi:WD40 repeat protein
VRAYPLLALVLLFAGCRTFPKTPDATLAGLTASHDGYLAGIPLTLGEPLVLNREDFVYDAKLSPDGTQAAVSRLGPKSFHLAIHDLSSPAKPRSDTAINPLEFDVDEVEFSPDGNRIATVSRDGALRIYSAKTGALEAAWLTEEPLVSVGWHPSGELLALGSAKGLVTLVSVPQLQHVAELRAHTDEVRAVAFTASGDLVSGSWDKRLLVFSVKDSNLPPREVRTHVTKKNGLVLFRAVLDRAASATVALDARMPMVVLKSALAQAAGIDALTLTDSVQVQTAFGNQLAKVAKGRVLSIKNLTFEHVDVAVCDACVPGEAQAVLGGPLLQQLAVAFDESTAEIVFTAGEGATVSSPKSLERVREFTLPASVNDVSLDARGLVAGVAFSETKSERTKAVYDREKKKEVEPAREWDCAARVDLATGQVLEKKTGHHGVVASVGISPDGKTLASGGWDKKVILHGAPGVVMDDYGWAIRRVRFSRDGRQLIVAAWTPQNPLNSHQSDPSAVVYEVIYGEASVTPR